MALHGLPPAPRLVGLALPLAFFAWPAGPNGPRIDCSFGPHVVGRASAIRFSAPSQEPDWDRLDRLTAIARDVSVPVCDWRTVALRLRRNAHDLGPLSAMDAYWLGTAWWAFHQPARHLRYPAWAPRAVMDPNLALRHPEGGNCESSANGHAALLNFLGVPSRAVYGRLFPSGEGHVWTISDVDGVPLAADVHVARVDEEARRLDLPWRPSPSQIQTAGSYAAGLRFAALHVPEDPRLNPIADR